MERYWEDLNGRIACYEHVGISARGWIDKGKTEFTTDLTAWVQLEDDEVAEFGAMLADHGVHGSVCEECRDIEKRHGSRTAQSLN